jgi:hypothetical protein
MVCAGKRLQLYYDMKERSDGCQDITERENATKRVIWQK